MILEDKARLIALRFKPHNHIALPAMTVEHFVSIVSQALPQHSNSLIDKAIMRVGELAKHEGQVSARRRAIEDIILVLEEMKNDK